MKKAIAKWHMVASMTHTQKQTETEIHPSEFNIGFNRHEI